MDDILNVYDQRTVTEKVWTALGPKFSKNAKRPTVIIRALYGLKLAGAAFISLLARCIESYGYMPCKANLDFCLKPEISQEDVVQYFSYLMCYVNGILCIFYNADGVLQQLHKLFPLKLGFGKPHMYVDAKLHKTRLHNRV